MYGQNTSNNNDNTAGGSGGGYRPIVATIQPIVQNAAATQPQHPLAGGMPQSYYNVPPQQQTQLYAPHSQSHMTGAYMGYQTHQPTPPPTTYQSAMPAVSASYGDGAGSAYAAANEILEAPIAMTSNSSLYIPSQQINTNNGHDESASAHCTAPNKATTTTGSDQPPATALGTTSTDMDLVFGNSDEDLGDLLSQLDKYSNEYSNAQVSEKAGAGPDTTIDISSSSTTTTGATTGLSGLKPNTPVAAVMPEPKSTPQARTQLQQPQQPQAAVPMPSNDTAAAAATLQNVSAQDVSAALGSMSQEQLQSVLATLGLGSVTDLSSAVSQMFPAKTIAQPPTSVMSNQSPQSTGPATNSTLRLSRPPNHLYNQGFVQQQQPPAPQAMPMMPPPPGVMIVAPPAATGVLLPPGIDALPPVSQTPVTPPKNKKDDWMEMTRKFEEKMKTKAQRDIEAGQVLLDKGDKDCKKKPKSVAEVMRQADDLEKRLGDLKKRRKSVTDTNQKLQNELTRIKLQHAELRRKAQRDKSGGQSQVPLMNENERLQHQILKQMQGITQSEKEIEQVLITGESQLKALRDDVKKRRREEEQALASSKTKSRSSDSKSKSSSGSTSSKKDSSSGKTKGKQADREKSKETERASHSRASPEPKSKKKKSNDDSQLAAIEKSTNSKSAAESLVVKEGAEKTGGNKGDAQKESEPEVYNYVYYDPGSHWCRECNSTHSSVIEHLGHLHTMQHRQRINFQDRPWVKEDEAVDDPSINTSDTVKMETKVTAIKGTEFLMPCFAYYCTLCEQFSGDAAQAEMHLKSKQHRIKYQNVLKVTPDYERTYESVKASSLMRNTQQTAAAGLFTDPSLIMPLPSPEPAAAPHTRPGEGTALSAEVESPQEILTDGMLVKVSTTQQQRQQATNQSNSKFVPIGHKPKQTVVMRDLNKSPLATSNPSTAVFESPGAEFRKVQRAGEKLKIKVTQTVASHLPAASSSATDSSTDNQTWTAADKHKAGSKRRASRSRSRDRHRRRRSPSRSRSRSASRGRDRHSRRRSPTPDRHSRRQQTAAFRTRSPGGITSAPSPGARKAAAAPAKKKIPLDSIKVAQAIERNCAGKATAEDIQLLKLVANGVTSQ